jgi:hypothetical protein
MTKFAFARYIGIDYSGAQTPTVKGLRIYLSDGEALPVEVAPPLSARKYWSRRGIAEWLVEVAPQYVLRTLGFHLPYDILTGI